MKKTKEENKEQFIAKLHTFLSKNTREFSDITAMHYVCNLPDDGPEYLYVNYGFSQKRIDITADSCSSILRDFLKKIYDAPWLYYDGPKYITFPKVKGTLLLLPPKKEKTEQL